MSKSTFPSNRDFSGAQQVLNEMLQMQAEQTKRLAGRLDAEEVCENLLARVRSFEAGLTDKEEIGVRLANFGEAAQIHIREIAHQNPNLIEFHGINADGHNVVLVQHISQLNFLLIAVKPVLENAYRIGFGR